jgi:hypothetical protein
VPRTDALAGLSLGAALTAIAFLTTGVGAVYPDARTTWTEIALILIGAVTAAALVLRGRRGPRWGAASLAAFAALALLTGLSVLWSVQPESSYLEVGRTLAYLAVFGTGIALARVLPHRWAAILGGVALASTVLSGYALLAKVFPATFDPSNPFGRLRVPFDYFNATGLIAALGLPACLWAGARREPSRWLRALAAPALAIQATVVVLSLSRGASLAAVVGLILWFALVPLRLRGAAWLSLGLAGAAVLSAVALSSHGLSANHIPLQQRVHAGHGFGLLVLAVLVLLAAAGSGLGFAAERVQPGPQRRRRIGTVLIVIVALLPVAGVLGLAESSRGLTGEISHLTASLTSTDSGARNSPNRLIELGNSRGRYWKEGLTVGSHFLLAGAGAMGYETALERYFADYHAVPQAHSYVVQTFADFGLIGIAVMLGLLISWAVAALRPLRGPAGAERSALLTLASVVVIFGVHSTIDWTWFIPGTAVPALLCAGWLAGRGPRSADAATSGRRLPAFDPARWAAVVLILAVAILISWEVWQPLRAASADAASLSAYARGDVRGALADARTAADADPVAVEPLWQLGVILNALGEPAAAEREYLEAVQRQPDNAQTWIALAQFDLQTHRPARALVAFRRGEALDRSAWPAIVGVAQAQAQIKSSRSHRRGP